MNLKLFDQSISYGNITGVICFLLFIALYLLKIICPTLINDQFFDLLKDLSMGAWMSFFINYLAVDIPAKTVIKRKAELFNENYLIFKRNVVVILLESISEGFYREDLLDIKEFKKFFTQDRWYAVMNALQDKPQHIERIQKELCFLKEEMQRVLDIVESLDSDTYQFFYNGVFLMNYHNRDCSDYDNLKSLMGLLWQIFSGWSFISGYAKRDPAMEAVDKAKEKSKISKFLILLILTFIVLLILVA